MMKWIIKGLPYAAVVYGGGISGAWLGRQFTTPLPQWVWGWFGAALTVFAILAGIELAMRRDNIGWAIVVLTGISTGVMDYQYFAGAHDFITAVALGVLPTGLGILTGVAASRLTVQQEAVRTERETDRERWERERQERNDEHRRKLEEMKLKAELKAVQPAAPVQVIHSGVNERRATRKDYSPVYMLIQSDPFISISKIAAETGISAGAIHGDLKANGWHKNGNGWEKHE